MTITSIKCWKVAGSLSRISPMNNTNISFPSSTDCFIYGCRIHTLIFLFFFNSAMYIFSSTNVIIPVSVWIGDTILLHAFVFRKSLLYVMEECDEALHAQISKLNIVAHTPTFANWFLFIKPMDSPSPVSFPYYHEKISCFYNIILWVFFNIFHIWVSVFISKPKKEWPFRILLCQLNNCYKFAWYIYLKRCQSWPLFIQFKDTEYQALDKNTSPFLLLIVFTLLKIFIIFHISF